ncbi:MAG TPA: hypothetical protein VF723_07265 [Pyrinomonadaceae bacterium]
MNPKTKINRSPRSVYSRQQRRALCSQSPAGKEARGRRNGRRSGGLLLLLLALAASLSISCGTRERNREPLTILRTLAGAATVAGGMRFGDPFGVAVSPDGIVYVTDGESGRLWQLAADGTANVVAEKLNVPSAIALAPDGSLVLAETGAHTIKRIEPRGGRITTLAGVEGRAGFADGNGTQALLNGPVGVAVAADGTVFVADTYNDRIRAIDAEGRVTTLAGGGEPGFSDAANGADARFDTPCGIALDPDGSLVVADTGNHRLRRVSRAGEVTTIAGADEPGGSDGPLFAVTFYQPMAVAVDAGGRIYVADAAGSAVRVCSFGLWPHVTTLAGGKAAGLSDGPLDSARLHLVSGLAVSPDETLVVADSGNKLVRLIAREGEQRGTLLNDEAIRALRPTPVEFRAQAAPRWPYDPPERTREIAATFGEIRGEVADGKDAWFHNGLDIPGAYGETARAVRTEKILRPLSVEGFGTTRERIRFPALGYIHLRIGRWKDDRPFDDDRFVLRRDGDGRPAGIRVRRGAVFAAGDAIGTLNNQNHVHLIAGPAGAEMNALAALELPGINDAVAPTIEANGILLLDRQGRRFGDGGEAGEKAQRRAAKRVETGEPVSVHGDVRVVVRAYDQMNGNAARRRLGLYQLGYQVLKQDGSPAQGFDQPLTTISFESLPDDMSAAPLAYFRGSQSGYTSETVFAYILTNVVRDRMAAENFWHASELPPGDYVLRVFAADFFGNRTTRDINVRITPGA